jgi:hypothetical protein
MQASLEGVMTSKWPGVYVLHLATLIEGEEASVSLENRITVPRANVLFWEQLS